MKRQDLIKELRRALALAESGDRVIQFPIQHTMFHFDDLEPYVLVHSYFNTTSEAGLPGENRLLASDVSHARVWTDSMANPNYVLHMHNGDTHFMPGQYGVMNNLPRVPESIVQRKKDLF